MKSQRKRLIVRQKRQDRKGIGSTHSTKSLQECTSCKRGGCRQKGKLYSTLSKEGEISEKKVKKQNNLEALEG